MQTDLLPNTCPQKKFSDTLTCKLKYKIQKINVEDLNHVQKLSITLEHRGQKRSYTDNNHEQTHKTRRVGRKPRSVPVRLIKQSDNTSECSDTKEMCQFCGACDKFDMTDCDVVCTECGTCAPSSMQMMLRTNVVRDTLYSSNGNMHDSFNDALDIDLDKLVSTQDYNTSTHFQNVFLWGIGDIKKNDTFYKVLHEINQVLVAPVSLCDVQQLLKKQRYPQTYRRYATCVYQHINGIERPDYKKRLLYDMISVHEQFAVACYNKYNTDKSRKYLLPYQAQIHFILQHQRQYKLLHYFPLPYHLNTLVLLRETVDLLKKCIVDVFVETEIKIP